MSGIPGNLAGGVGKRPALQPNQTLTSPQNDAQDAHDHADLAANPDGTITVTPSVRFTVKDTVVYVPITAAFTNSRRGSSQSCIVNIEAALSLTIRAAGEGRPGDEQLFRFEDCERVCVIGCGLRRGCSLVIAYEVRQVAWPDVAVRGRAKVGPVRSAG